MLFLLLCGAVRNQCRTEPSNLIVLLLIVEHADHEAPTWRHDLLLWIMQGVHVNQAYILPFAPKYVFHGNGI